jgi:transposase InsO family protein
VERANRTHTEEFYEVTPCLLVIAALNRELQAWEWTYNTVRPHQALAYLAPQEFLAQSPSLRKDIEWH